MDFLVLTKTGGILGPFATVLGYIIDYIYKGLEWIGIPNTGLAIILFTFIVNLILMPLTIKQQKTSKMMSVMNPELQKIQAKYKDKKDEVSMRKMQAETSAVYEKYGTSPTGGCLYMIIQLPILFALYQVIYRVPAYVSSVNELYMNIAQPLSQVAGGGEMIQELISSLSLQRIANFDFSNTNSIIDFLAALKTADWSVVSETFSSSAAVVDAIRTYSPEIIRVNSIFGVLNMSDLPLSNGFFPGVLIPVLSAVTQLISIKVSMASQPQQDNGSNPMGNMKAMNYGMVIFSMIICFTFNIGIGLYWIANAVFRTVTMVLANRVIDKKGVDKIIEENKAKKKKKEEKRGGKPSKFEEYAKMSTKNYDEQMAAAQKKKSIRELAATSTMTEAELKNKNVSKTAKTSDDAQSSNSKSNKKDKNQAGNIAAIAHMLDNDNYRKR